MKKIVSILIDHSGSMGRDHKPEHIKKYLVGNKTRTELAQEILRNQIIPILANSDRVIIQTFKSDSKGINYEGRFIQESDFDEKQIVQAIMHIGIPTAGGTPISAGIRDAIKRLSTHPNHEKFLIIITDGEETGNEDYASQIKEIGQKNFCKVYIIGLGLDVALSNKASEAANFTGGSFANILLPQNTPYESVVIDASEQLSELKSLLRKSINQNNPDASETATAVENEQRNELIRAESEKFLYNYLIQQYGDRVLWLNNPVEKGYDHDFEIAGLHNNDHTIFIECKGTPSNKPTFYLTANEWQLSLKHGSRYELYFIQHCFDNPKVTLFRDILESLSTGKLLPYSLEEEHLQPKRIALTVASL